MPDPSNLQPEFKYFSAEVFTNVYDGVNQIKMPKSLMILGFSNDKDAAIPVRHDKYIFRREVLRDLLAFLRKPNGDALFITGPTGSGKTSVVNEVCARLNWPVQLLTLNNRFEFSQLTGHFTYSSQKEGGAPEMTFQYGPLAKAMKYGHVLVLNEIDLADAGELAGLRDGGRYSPYPLIPAHHTFPSPRRTPAGTPAAGTPSPERSKHTGLRPQSLSPWR